MDVKEENSSKFVSDLKIMKSWQIFSKKYGIYDGITIPVFEDHPEYTYYELFNRAIDIQRTDSYPIILLPKHFINKMSRPFSVYTKKDDNCFYIEDFYDAANDENAGNYEYEWKMNSLTMPSKPKVPTKPVVSPYYTVYYNRPYRVSILLLPIAAEGLTLLIILQLAQQLLWIVIGIVLSSMFILWIYSKIIDRVAKFFMKMFTKTKKYTAIEIDELEKKRDEKFAAALDVYAQELKTYENQYAEYLENRQYQSDFLNDPSNQKRVFLNFYRHSFAPSKECSPTEDIPQKGWAENALFYELMKRIPEHVKIDMQIDQYYPDIVIQCGSVNVDVEIDEPYDFKTRKETHYWGCSDEYRNEYFTENDWIVIRFTESQIVKHLNACVNLIVDFVESFSYKGYDSFMRLHEFEFQESLWTKEQSRMMAIENYRQSYLKDFKVI